MPPLAFTSLAHSVYPFSKAWPSTALSPVRDSEAPIVIGADDAEADVLALELELVLVLELLLLLLLLVQAARTLTESTATALRAMAFMENQGGLLLNTWFLLPR
jgi:hypothetical protein